MAYRIEYGPEIKNPGRKTGIRLQTMTALFLLLFCLMVNHFWPEGKQILRQILLPGNGTATQAAVHALISDLHEGDSFGDAFTAFCQEIVNDAQNEG